MGQIRRIFTDFLFVILYGTKKKSVKIRQISVISGLPNHQSQIINQKMVQIFVTGGTFDKEYNYITGELYFKDTHQIHARTRALYD